MENIADTYLICLANEYARRARTNPNYSLRSFARQLDVDSSTLSQVMTKKRPLSLKMMNKLQQKLQLPVGDSYKATTAFTQLETDKFSIIADWYHFAILDLVQLKSFKNDSTWIAKTLAIEEHEARMAIDRLLRIGLLRQEKGLLKKGDKFVSSYVEGVTSEAHKEYQRQVIRKALSAVDEVTQELKDITSITIAGNSKKISVAKALIKDFRRKLCELMEDGQGDHVFHLTIQLYPVSKGEANEA